MSQSISIREILAKLAGKQVYSDTPGGVISGLVTGAVITEDQKLFLALKWRIHTNDGEPRVVPPIPLSIAISMIKEVREDPCCDGWQIEFAGDFSWQFVTSGDRRGRWLIDKTLIHI